jgi:hypothetical protein
MVRTLFQLFLVPLVKSGLSREIGLAHFERNTRGRETRGHACMWPFVLYMPTYRQDESHSVLGKNDWMKFVFFFSSPSCSIRKLL